MKTTTRRRTILLSDQPSSEDLFGGSHGLVADAIAEIVRMETGGKGIGIEGGWGSGKSTVVNLVCKKLKADRDVTPITFDAWVHQGDHLRRAFLETLIRKLIACAWVDEPAWQKKLEQLSRRVRTSERRTTPTLTSLAKVLAVSVALVPFGSVLFTVGTRPDTFSWLYLLLGFALALGPAGVMFLAYLRADKHQDIWALLVNKHVTTEQLTVTEDPDPTSIEFRELFYELMGAALQPPSRRILVIVDNLDRIPAEDARVIWSLLRTFLEYSEHENPAWFHNLWVLVPYDSKSLKALLPKNELTGEEAKAAPASFVDKSIQVKFYVAPPILSNWRGYLLGLLAKAFPDHSAEEPEFNSIYRLYAVQADASKTALTPRELILYVNDIGALHRQWDAAVRLSHMAYYALARRQTGDNVISEFLAGKIPQPAELSILGADLDESLAILHFNVPKGLAREVLLKAPIANALALADADTLKRLASQQVGFVPVLEHVLPSLLDEWVPGDTGKYANAARCIVDSAVLGEVRTVSKDSITETLIHPLDTAFSWAPFVPKTADGIACLIKLTPNATMATKIVETIKTTSLESPLTNTTQASDVVNWLEALWKVLGALRNNNLLTEKTPTFTVPTNAEFWIPACKRLHELDASLELARYISPSISHEEIGGFIAKAVTAGHVSPDHLIAIRVGQASEKKPNYESISTAIHARIVRPEQNAATETAGMFEMLWMLGKLDEKYESYLNKAVNEGGVLHQLHWAVSSKQPQTIAWAAFLYLRTKPDAQMGAALHQGQSGYNQLTQILANPAKSGDVVKEFVAIIEREGEFPLLLKIFDAAPAAKPFIITCLRQFAAANDLYKVIGTTELPVRWQLVREQISEDRNNPLILDVLVNHLCTVDKFSEQVISNKFNLDSSGLYASMARTGLATDSTFVGWCNRGLDGVSDEGWAAALEKEDDLIELLAALTSADSTSLTLGIAYQDGLVTHAKKLIADSAHVKRFAPQWGRFLKPLSVQRREVLQGRLRDAAEAVDGAIGAQYFELWGDEIGTATALTSDRRTVAHLFTPILTKRNQAGLQWLQRVLQREKDLLDAYQPQSDVSDFKERLQRAVEQETDAEHRALLTSIATLARIELRPPEASELKD